MEEAEMTTAWRRLRDVVVVIGMVSGTVACSGSLCCPAASSLAPSTIDGLDYGRDEGAGLSAQSLATPLTPDAVAGVWVLFTVDGGPLPFVTALDREIKTELVRDTLTLAANGTSTEEAVTRFTAGPRVQTATIVENGSFAVDGGTILFVGKYGKRRTATLNRDLLVASVDGKTWVFRRL
jgi:hypothetical protein